MAGAHDNELVGRATRNLLEQTARTTGLDYFKAMARALAETLGTRFGFVGGLVDGTSAVRTLAVWNGKGYAENFEYALAGTPCAGVLAGEACHYPSGVASLFPQDAMLVDMGIESYLGLPIQGRDAPALGLVVALHDKPTLPAPQLAAVLELFADRAAVEIERMRFEAALTRSEARYRQMVTSCAEGVWTVDSAGMTTFVNAQMAAMLGYTEAEMLGRSFLDFMDDAGRADSAASLARRVAGVTERREFRYLHKDGRDVWTMLSASPLHGPAGTYVGALALVSDITETRRLAAAASQAKRLESLGVLAGGVAHDYNNLLVGILGNAEVALRQSAVQDRALLDIRAAALRASELTRQLLAFAGRGTFSMEPVDLNALISEMGMLLSAALSKKTELRFLPAAKTAMVEGDAGQLSQMVMNLITNASEAHGDRPGVVTISTGMLHADRNSLDRRFPDASLAPGDYVTLEVVDGGCGMDAATKERIFEPFFTTKFTGRGLGLAAMLGVLRAHGGAIDVDSEPGKGTTVSIVLPVAAHEPVTSSASEPPVAALTGRVVLVADDEKPIRNLLSYLLEEEGCRVLLAVDGLDALETFRRHADEIDLVVLDLTMPGMSGEDVFRELRRARPDLKVVLTSGYADTAIAERLGGPTTFLAKPWTIEALLTALRAIITR